MRNFIASLSVLLLMGGGPLFAQKILLKIASVTPAEGEQVRAAEFKVENTVNWGMGGGGTAGQAAFKDFLIKKSNSTSSNELYRRLILGTATPAVVLEYYDASDVMYFSITLRTVYVTNFYWLSPECPTCLALDHQVAFAFQKIETFDPATGITIKFDIALNTTY